MVHFWNGQCLCSFARQPSGNDIQDCDIRNGGYVDVDICSPFYEKKEIKECDMIRPQIGLFDCYFTKKCNKFLKNLL